ncbi:MAG: response regulator transcription factor [Chloroflexi bacterium]|nr:response regulator transcription factor [Chloroflexota bacterium]
MFEFPRILLVDDDPDIRRILSFNLESDGYKVMAAPTGRDALQAVSRKVPDLAIVDLLLPDMHGFEVCREIKKFLNVPIIMLTAVGTEKTIVEGLRQYAEDYVVKPFRYPQLLARIERILKRTAGSRPQESEIVLDGRITVDFAKHSVKIDSNEVKLTPIESRILSCLSRTPNRVVSTEKLMDEVWPDGEGDPERLRVHIRSLRAKIEPDPSDPRYILTRRGGGYLFALSREQSANP